MLATPKRVGLQAVTTEAHEALPIRLAFHRSGESNVREATNFGILLIRWAKLAHR
jgi:hypothetical protein